MQPKESHVLTLHWRNPAFPLVSRAVKPTSARGPATFSTGRPWVHTGASNEPFDFTAAVRRLLEDIAQRCPEFAYIQVPRILITVTQARGGALHGLQARVTPLRFPHGQLTRQRGGVTYHIQRYFLDDCEFLYVLTFCLPRFLDQSFDEKFITLFHELYHIHPEFNGDLRRHEGRYAFHTHSQCAYDKAMIRHARDYLASGPRPALTDFLRMDFTQLNTRHGSVTGIVVPRPKVVPLIGPNASAAKTTPNTAEGGSP